MDPDILFFFDKHPGALPLYQTWESRILAEVEHVTVKVQKTQITFANRRQFACVSFLPARRAKDRPEDYITVTLGLNRRLDSPRVDKASEPYPGRWTHHAALTREADLDGELLGWLEEARDFCRAKGRGKA